MKHTLLAAAALSSGIIVTPAFAADMAPATAPAYKAAPMAPVSAYNWTGFYVGGNVGGGWSSLSSSVLSPGSAAFPVGTVFETSSSSSDRSGWVVGAGIEWGFAPNWSAKLEYDHIDFGSKTFTSLGSVTGTSLFSSSEKIDEVKGGVNYRFNWWGGPVVAKY